MQVKGLAVETFRAEWESMIHWWAGNSLPSVLRGLEGCSTLQEVLLVCTDLDQVAGLSPKLVDPDQKCGKRDCAGNGDPEAAIWSWNTPAGFGPYSVAKETFRICDR